VRAQPGVAARVACERSGGIVAFAVEFDGEALGVEQEVQHVWAERGLAAAFGPERVVADRVPEAPLRRSQIAAQRTRTRG